MSKIIECVPNFSVGVDEEVIRAIIDSVIKSTVVKLLDASSDPDHGRLVLTFIGKPSQVKEAAFASAKQAVKLIDLSKHVGAHPYIGAVDVIPFVPLKNATISDCVKLAEDLGREIAVKLGVPVFLYGEAAKHKERKGLGGVRRGGLKVVEEKIKRKGPDFGKKTIHPTAGAVAVGVRDILIAYNVNLESRDLDAAKSIASKIRESNGGLPGVKALGVDLKSKNLVQVSMNLTDYRKTGIKKAFDTVAAEAKKRGVSIHSSEIVGLIPRAASFSGMAEYLKLESFCEGKILETYL